MPPDVELDLTPEALRRTLERRAARAPDGGVEAHVDGVIGRKLGRLWRVLSTERWVIPSAVPASRSASRGSACITTSANRSASSTERSASVGRSSSLPSSATRSDAGTSTPSTTSSSDQPSTSRRRSRTRATVFASPARSASVSCSSVTGQVNVGLGLLQGGGGDDQPLGLRHADPLAVQAFVLVHRSGLSAVSTPRTATARGISACSPPQHLTRYSRR